MYSLLYILRLHRAIHFENEIKTRTCFTLKIDTIISKSGSEKLTLTWPNFSCFQPWPNFARQAFVKHGFLFFSFGLGNQTEKV